MKIKNKLVSRISLALCLAFILSSCGGEDKKTQVETTQSTLQNHTETTRSNTNTLESQTGTVPPLITDATIPSVEYGEFSISSSDGKFIKENNIINITSGGTYALSGELDGQITVNAPESDEVILELNEAKICCSSDSAIKIISASKVEISAKSDTVNVIEDMRNAKTTDVEAMGEGAIYAKSDLKIKGNGSLAIIGNYNNGIHSTKDLTIQKLTLKVIAYNNAIKGNDSVNIKSGNITAISVNGDGIKTENTDASKDGTTRGDITVIGGTLTVYAAGDGISSAHNFELCKDVDTPAPSVSVYTGTNSSYTSSASTVESKKGIKVQNELNIKDGNLNVNSIDDGLHADYGMTFTDGTVGLGTINVSGGNIKISVDESYKSSSSNGGTSGGGMQGGQFEPPSSGRPGRPEKPGRPKDEGFGNGEAVGIENSNMPETNDFSPMMGQGGFPGQPGQGGFPGQQGGGGSDAIHADHELNISGGNISIEKCYEGLEANVINVSGGTTYVIASDDGANSVRNTVSAQINVTGGYLDITTPSNGDIDGIDSNGTYTQTGGIVIVRGPGQSMSAALDTDGGATITSGTLIALGYANIRAQGNVKSYTLSLNSQGSHTVIIDGEEYTINNSYSYRNTVCYSSVTVSD